MKLFNNVPKPYFCTSVLMLAGVLLSLGCAKGSPLSFGTNSLFRDDAALATASDLKVSESYSTSTEWFESYEDAHRESLRTGKPMLAVFSGSDWCGPCIQLKTKVFESPGFMSWAAENVVLLELDFPKKSPQSPELQTQNQRLAEKYNITGYPTVLYLDADGEVLGKQGHGVDATQWIAAAERKLR